MEDSTLDYMFNPSEIKYFYTQTNKKQDKESERVSKKFIDEEKNYFKEICKELIRDMVGLGLSVNFSSKILIRNVAMNIIFLKKVIFQMSGTTLVNNVPKKVIPLKNGIITKYTPFYHEVDLHPFFEKLIFKLQREIDNGLKQLGLLPIQQIERQKLTIVKKLREKYENFDKEYIVKAESQKSLPNKRKTQTKEINAK